jgi:membrane fusion protein, heavy metal efflux system
MNNMSFAKQLLFILMIGAVAGCGKQSDTKTESTQETVREVKDSTVTQAADASGAQAALCAAHKLPVSVCYLCDASLRDPNRLWCQEHNRYEDRCFICHPDQREAGRLYCDEHGLYEDECIFCHPDLLRSALSPSGSEHSPALQCDEHHVPEAECGICHPELAETLRPGQGLKIRFPSETSAEKAGITAQPMRQTEAGAFVSAMGRLEFNQNRAAKIASPIEGQVMRVLVDLGQEVRQGQVLAEINAQGWGEALAEEKAAKAALDREEELHRERVSATRDLEEARARYERARAARLAAQGSGAGANIVTQGDGDPRLALRAPVSGTVVSRAVSMGDVASPGSVLMEVADLDPLWAMLSLPEASAALVRKGDVVDLSQGEAELGSGQVDWIADVIDPATRMVTVRAIVPNPHRALRAGTYVEARIRTGSNANTVLVPRDATARFGGKPFVFLELLPDLFEIRRVEVSGEMNGLVAVVAGLHEGDRVVSTQSYLVKSEFQKSRLGAGCVD